MKKKISIIICVYNEIDRLHKTLEKINKWFKNTNYSHDIDLNIVDDGSSDETVTFIENYKELKINLIKKKHSGLMSSFIYGFQKIDADFYILLAADLPVSLNYLDDNKTKENSFIAINIGTGKGTSVLELVQTFEKVNKININKHFVKRRIGDKAVVYANAKMAKKILKWEASRSIEDMCRDGWNWQMNNPDGY